MGADLLSGSRIDSERGEYVEEIDYSPLRRSFLDRVSLPAILVAAGCLVLVVLLSFLFVRMQTSSMRSQIYSLADRVDALENRLLNVDGAPQVAEQVKAQTGRIDSLNARVNRMEASMPTIMDQIKRELDNLQKKTAEVKSHPAPAAAAPEPKVAAAAKVPGPAKAPAQPVYHTVNKGETLYSISRKYKDRYGMSMDKIIKINKLDAKGTIYTGQKLIVGP
jgi:LysM repeat protein